MLLLRTLIVCKKSMGKFKDNINAIDLKKLTLTDSMMNSIAILSKAPDTLDKTLQDAIETSFEKMTAVFVSAIKESIAINTTTATVNTLAIIKKEANVPVKNIQQQQPVSDINLKSVAALLREVLPGIDFSVKPALSSSI